MAKMPKLGQLIGQYLSDREKDQKELADRLGVHPGNISKWIAGSVGISWRHYDKILSYLEIPRDTFFRIAEEENPRMVEQYKEFSSPKLTFSRQLEPVNALTNFTIATRLKPNEMQAINRLAQAFSLNEPRITEHLINQIDLLIDMANGKIHLPPSNMEKGAAKSPKG